MQSNTQLYDLYNKIKLWVQKLGFSDVRVTDVDLPKAEKALNEWVEKGCHGEMGYMASHGTKRSRANELVPGVIRAITVRMDYLPQEIKPDWRDHENMRKEDSMAAQVSLYARGRDYHRVLRQRLQQLASRIEQEIGTFGYRVFVDSGPVMEVALAEKAGLGWRGKNNLLLNQKGGSLFFLGEILTDLPLHIEEPISEHCGTCQKCIDVCPTGAITRPYFVDARRCISYLTIELKGTIPVDLRHLVGNRIYGCDDCQLCCPWNKFAQKASAIDFSVRHGLDSADLIGLFSWEEEEFNRRLEGSAIRRIGYERWLRNIAVSLGNAGRKTRNQAGRISIVNALKSRIAYPSILVQEHVEWALSQIQ